jgi:hypothetical protein
MRRLENSSTHTAISLSCCHGLLLDVIGLVIISRMASVIEASCFIPFHIFCRVYFAVEMHDILAGRDM